MTELPLHLSASKETTSDKWQKILEWKGTPGKTFLVSGYDFDTDWDGAAGNCELKITSNGEEIVHIDNSIVTYPNLYWFTMNPLRFEGVNPNGHLVFLIKSDGTNTLQANVQVYGLQIKGEE